MSADPQREVISVTDLTRTYDHGTVVAATGVSFAVPEGGSLGIVGESGSGKTTVARMIAGLELPDSGEILIDGSRAGGIRRLRDRRARARVIQMVFQDPYQSLDPRQTPREMVEEMLGVHTPLGRADRASRAAVILDQVGLTGRMTSALPRDLSGGQRQRVALARALAATPKVIILDEATSALDVSIQAQILELLAEIRAELGVALIAVSHDIGVVRQITDDLVVMFRGRVVEAGRTRTVLDDPQHDYTKLLLDSIPRAGWNPESVGERRRALLAATTRSIPTPDAAAAS